MSNIFDLFKKIETKGSAKPVTHIVVGLGNPGAEYERTRHNAGFLAIDNIAEKYRATVDRVRFNALVGEAEISGVRVMLMKPTTFMNNSGQAVAKAADFYKIPAENVIVIHDEISFDPGAFRIRKKGSAGGHNGLKSIIACLSSEDFPRIKVGVGKKPSPDYDLAAWVLGKFPEADLKAVKDRLDDVCSSVELMLAGKTEEAMNKFSR